ncbi:hypothetical protein FPZ46_27970, partial [Mycobacterium helveticum]
PRRRGRAVPARRRSHRIRPPAATGRSARCAKTRCLPSPVRRSPPGWRRGRSSAGRIQGLRKPTSRRPASPGSPRRLWPPGPKPPPPKT